MGCDGGSIPRRDEMVKLKKKGEKVDRNMELAAKWRHCAISANKLSQPIVACELGRLYNKESVLMALLDKDNLPEIASHIKSLKDIHELKLTPNPSFKESEKHSDDQSSEYICPVTGLEMSGHHRFAFLRSCGCVLSEKALKEVPSETCHKCAKGFKKDDIVIINGTEEDVIKQREAIEERRRSAKLSKQRKRKPESQKVNGDSSSCSSSELMEALTSAGVPKLPDPAGLQKIPDPVDESSLEKRPKLTAGSKGKASATKSTARKKSSVNGIESRKAYRSMFTSSAPERSKEQSSHWVTFFPYH